MIKLKLIVTDTTVEFLQKDSENLNCTKQVKLAILGPFNSTLLLAKPVLITEPRCTQQLWPWVHTM